MFTPKELRGTKPSTHRLQSSGLARKQSGRRAPRPTLRTCKAPRRKGRRGTTPPCSPTSSATETKCAAREREAQKVARRWLINPSARCPPEDCANQWTCMRRENTIYKCAPTQHNTFGVEKCRWVCVRCPPEDSNGNKRPPAGLGPAFSLSNMYISLRHKERTRNGRRLLYLLSLARSPGYWWFLSLRAVHIYRSPPAVVALHATDYVYWL